MNYFMKKVLPHGTRNKSVLVFTVQKDCEQFNFLYPDCSAPNPTWIGDGGCDVGVYNTSECGWDEGDCVRFETLYPNCSVGLPTRIGDGVCQNAEYNVIECGFDGGDCESYNANFPDCDIIETHNLGNGYCDGEEFNTEACLWDGGDCTGKIMIEMFFVMKISMILNIIFNPKLFRIQ